MFAVKQPRLFCSGRLFNPSSSQLLRAQERPATLILTVISGLRITRARHVYNRARLNRKLKFCSATKNDQNAKNVSIVTWDRSFCHIDRRSFVADVVKASLEDFERCLLYTSPSPRDGLLSRMPSSA